MSMPGPRIGAATGWQQFAADERAKGAETNQLWHQILAEGLPFLLERQAENEALGSNDACVYCYRPFGPNLGRNRLNRYYCDDCDTFIRTMPGQAELVLPTLVVDIRNSTGIEQSLGADWVRAIRRFRRDVGRTVQRHYGFVMNTAGDSLMAVFPPGFLPPSERGRTNAAAEAIAAAETLAARSPTEYVDGRLPYGTAVHATDMMLFSVRGDEEDDFFFDDDDDDGAWMASPTEVSGPVSIDMAGEAIVVACVLSDAAAAGEALITEAADREAGKDVTEFVYEDKATKAAPVRIRHVRAEQSGSD